MSTLPSVAEQKSSLLVMGSVSSTISSWAGSWNFPSSTYAQLH